jgi:hypothetical protein
MMVKFQQRYEKRHKRLPKPLLLRELCLRSTPQLPVRSKPLISGAGFLVSHRSGRCEALRVLSCLAIRIRREIDGKPTNAYRKVFDCRLEKHAPKRSEDCLTSIFHAAFGTFVGI